MDYLLYASYVWEDTEKQTKDETMILEDEFRGFCLTSMTVGPKFYAKLIFFAEVDKKAFLFVRFKLFNSLLFPFVAACLLIVALSSAVKNEPSSAPYHHLV